MVVVDVNLLLYAVISGFPQHEVARSWWEATLNGSEEVGLASPAIFGFLRIATNPRILESPLAMEAATRFVNDWFAQPGVRYLVPGQRHLGIAFDLLREVGTAGNLTTGVQLAALAIEQDAEMCSNDTDFGRFAGLRWNNPLT